MGPPAPLVAGRFRSVRKRKRVVPYADLVGADADTIHPMTAVQAVIVVGGSFLFLTPVIALMIRANQSERRHIERRRAEWIAGGRIPEEEPNFYSGFGGGSSS
jgi:hypothetical protein